MSSVVKESVLIPSGPLCARLRFGAFGWVCAWVLALAPSAPSAETWVWVDEEGRTHFTDDRERVPQGAKRDVVRGRVLADLWADGLTGPEPTTPPGGSGGESDRVTRILMSAVADLERGEEARARAAFQSALREL